MKFRFKYLISGVLMLLLVSLFMVGPVSAGNVKTINKLPYVINNPGNYVLGHDFTNFKGDVAIDVRAQNVVIDGQNFKLGGMDNPNSIGIKVKDYKTRNGIKYSPENVIIKNVKINDFATGVLLYQARGSSVADNVFTSNDEAVHFQNGENSEIINNKFTENLNSVTLASATHTTINGNIFSKDKGVGVTVGTGSTETKILTNTLSSEKLGILLKSGSTTATVTENKVLATTDPEDAKNTGIKIDGSSGNVINNNYFNTFNNVKATDSVNTWSMASLGKNIAGGPSIGGNAWLMPDGTGFSQTGSDNNRDGFVDTSFIINSMNRDVMPLKV